MRKINFLYKNILSSYQGSSYHYLVGKYQLLYTLCVKQSIYIAYLYLLFSVVDLLDIFDKYIIYIKSYFVVTIICKRILHLPTSLRLNLIAKKLF